MQFAQESIATVIDEIGPLLLAHWQEIAQFHDIPLNVDFDHYKRAEAYGQLRIYTVRREHELVGYAIYILAPAPHYSTSLQAKEDVIYLKPEYRKGRVGWKLIEFADERLRLDRVQVVYHHVKPSHDFGPLLKHIGYTFSESVYSRRLD